MSEIVVAIFPGEGAADEVAQQLSSTAAQDGIVIRSAALLVRGADGSVSERKWTSRVPWKAPAGAIVGALIGFLGGPIGAAIGFASGGALGAVTDVSDEARREARLRDMHTRLRPGTSALVVDLDERSLHTFSSRMHELGGEVIATGLTVSG